MRPDPRTLNYKKKKKKSSSVVARTKQAITKREKQERDKLQRKCVGRINCVHNKVIVRPGLEGSCGPAMFECLSA